MVDEELLTSIGLPDGLLHPSKEIRVATFKDKWSSQ